MQCKSNENIQYQNKSEVACTFYFIQVYTQMLKKYSPPGDTTIQHYFPSSYAVVPPG